MTSTMSSLGWLIVLFISLFFYVIPVIFAVILVVSHIKIHSSLKQVHKKLDAMKSSGTPAA